MSEVVEPANSLVAVREVVTGPLSEIAHRFSRAINGRCPHMALTIYTRECTCRPRKIAGARDIIERVTVAELDDLKREIEPGAQFAGQVTLARRARRVWAVRDVSDTLLVLVVEKGVEPAIAAQVSAMFGLVATSIRQQVTQASPDYLVESRAASVERARTIAELTAVHEVTLLSILSALRSSRFDDGHARTVAAQTASASLVGLRATGEYRLTVGGLGRGALLARYALAKSETEGVDTRTGFYVSWNGTPHRTEEGALMERVGWWPRIPVKIKVRSQAEVDWFGNGEFDRERIDDSDEVMTQSLGRWLINTIS
ncbi:hypothetical protein ACFXG4_48600 [Nocardia sp. NPDC059246]|uniref:hypothetical protein n=1 Tax=unclassified Nocardia TaxID=2637762 RepID=UPI0036C48ADA